MLRDLLQAIYQRIRVSHPRSTIAIQSTSMESIHDFDLAGAISGSVADMDRR